VLEDELARADLILLLISASFLGSDELYDVVMVQALERHWRKEALVIPVLLRPVDWEAAPFGMLQCLPSNLLAVTAWRNADEAFLDIERGVRRAIEARETGGPFRATEPSPPDASPEQRRALDAALPARVVVGQLTEVLAMVATERSGGLRALVSSSPSSFCVGPEDVRSTHFDLAFPLDERGRPGATVVTVALHSPDFEPSSLAKRMLVPPNRDSAVCTLLLTPKRAGVLSLQIELLQEDLTIWSQRLETRGVQQPEPGPPSYLVTSLPLFTVGRGLPTFDPAGGPPPIPPMYWPPGGPVLPHRPVHVALDGTTAARIDAQSYEIEQLDGPRRGLGARGAGTARRGEREGNRESLDVPNFHLRAALAVTLLIAFYSLVIGTALAFATFPVVWMVMGGRFSVPLLLLCWSVAGLLLTGAVESRVPSFRPRGRRLSRTEAPGLFDLLQALAARTGIGAPDEVYLTAAPEAGVTQTGGLLRQGTRILVLGLPLLDTLTIAELRAVLAHEYGHFGGGDTRLLRLGARAHSLFASTLKATKGIGFRDTLQGNSIYFAVAAGHALAGAIAHIFASLYFLLTLPISRREELAADRLAAQVAGRDAMRSALERMPQIEAYDLYLARDVALAMKRSVMPNDLLDGFRTFRRRFFESTAGRRFLDERRSAPTSPYDSHPSLADRIRALGAMAAQRHDGGNRARDDGDAARAVELLVDAATIHAWLALETQALAGPRPGVQRLPWAEIASRVHAPDLQGTARAVAARLHPVFPAAQTLAAMFTAVARSIRPSPRCRPPPPRRRRQRS
jgi:Zn-dependent protease with chaperone function